tara:strand:+ start:468 stop:704 length:237 start_codon:yes stop_codon:yes gene_type:complete
MKESKTIKTLDKISVVGIILTYAVILSVSVRTLILIFPERFTLPEFIVMALIYSFIAFVHYVCAQLIWSEFKRVFLNR